MLIIYKKNTMEIVSISGFTSPATIEAINSIQLANGIPQGHAEIRIYDFELIQKIWEAKDVGALIELKEQENGEIIVVPYAPLMLKCPNHVQANDQVIIEAQVEGGDGKPVSLFIDDEEQAQATLPVAWPVIFETVGTYKVKVEAGNHGAIEQEVIVE